MCLLLLFGWAGIGCASKTNQVVVDYHTVTPSSDRNTDRARQLNGQAIELIHASRLDDAETAARTALSHDVKFGPAHNTLGRVYFHQERYYLAAWEFQYAIRLMPHHPQPRNNLAMVFEEVGKLEAAANEYDLALELEPDNPEIIANLARVRDKQGADPEELRDLLIDVLMKDHRTSWRNWARQRLAALGQPVEP